jgi:hypothetical protein
MDAHTKKYSIFHIPVFSFFSRELYRDVGMHWKGVNFLYLLLLLAIIFCSQSKLRNNPDITRG